MKIKNIFNSGICGTQKSLPLLSHSSDELWHPRPWLIGPSDCGVCGTWDRAGLFSIDLRPINTIDPSAQARFTHQKAHLKHPHKHKRRKAWDAIILATPRKPLIQNGMGKRARKKYLHMRQSSSRYKCILMCGIMMGYACGARTNIKNEVNFRGWTWLNGKKRKTETSQR